MDKQPIINDGEEITTEDKLKLLFREKSRIIKKIESNLWKQTEKNRRSENQRRGVLTGNSRSENRPEVGDEIESAADSKDSTAIRVAEY